MEDLPSDTVGNVVGYDTTTKKLSYFPTPTGGGGDENLDAPITVTNQDEGFAHILDVTYGTGDTYTEVLEAILSPYNRTTISLDRIDYFKETSSGVWGPKLNWTSSSATVEVGQAFKINSIQYSIDDTDQTTDTSVDFRKNSADIQTGFTDSDSSLQALSSEEEYLNESVVSTSGDSYIFDVVAVDDGGTSLGDETITSNTQTIKSYHRLRIGGYSDKDNGGYDTLENAANAKALFDNMTTAKDILQGRSNATAVANAAMNDDTKYTWIMYPSLWGDLSNIYLLPGTPLGIGGSGAWLDKQTFTFANDYGHNVEYYAYRSSITGPYNDTTGQEIQLIF